MSMLLSYAWGYIRRLAIGCRSLIESAATYYSFSLISDGGLGDILFLKKKIGSVALYRLCYISISRHYPSKSRAPSHSQ